jgi:hypothetical protein
VAERVSALTLGARSAIGGGDRSTGCGLLRQAAGLQPTREIQDEIAGSRCATR